MPAPLGVLGASAVYDALNVLATSVPALIPALPPGFHGNLALRVVANANQLTQAELQQVLDDLSQDVNFVNGGTRLQADPLAGDLLNLAGNADAAKLLMVRAIKAPRFNLAYRTAIRSAFLRIELALGADVSRNLNQALSTLIPQNLNQLSMQDLRALLTTINTDGTFIQVSDPNALPIALNVVAGDPPDAVVTRLLAAMTQPRLSKAQRDQLITWNVGLANIAPTANEVNQLKLQLNTMRLTQQNYLTQAELQSILNAYDAPGTRLQVTNPQAAALALEPTATLPERVRAAIHRPALTHPQRTNIVNGILSVDKYAAAAGAPAFPANAQLESLYTLLSTMPLATADYLTHNELQQLLETLNAEPHKLFVKIPSGARIDLRIDAAIPNLIRDAITSPGMNPLQRSAVFRAIGVKVQLNLDQRNALSKTLCTMPLAQANFLSLQELQKLLASVNEPGTRLQVTNLNGASLDLNQALAAIQATIEGAIITPSIQVEKRRALREGLLIFAGSHTEAQSQSLDALLSTMQISNIQQQILTDKENQDLRKALGKEEKPTAFVIPIPPTCCTDQYKDGDCWSGRACFWSNTNKLSGDPDARKSLSTSRAGLKLRLDRLEAVISVSGIFIGSVMVIIGAIASYHPDNRNLHYTQIILPGVLAAVTGICKSLHTRTKNYYNINEKDLASAGILVNQEEKENSLAPVAAV